MLNRVTRKPAQEVIAHTSRKYPHIPIFPDVKPVPITKETVDIQGTNLIGFLRQEQRAKLNKDGRWSLFDKSNPNRIHAGSMIRISFKPSSSANKPIFFSGVLIAIERHPSEPTILIRSSVDGLGVEQKFAVMSPLIEKIEVMQAATLLVKHKLYMLREQPGLITKFSIPAADQARRVELLKGRKGKVHWAQAKTQ